MYQLGNVLVRKRAFGEANGLFRSSLDIHYKRYSVHNPLVSFPRTGFARSQLGLGLLDSAAKGGEIALKNREATLGPSHPDTAETLVVLGQPAEAENRRERLGPAHPDTEASRAALQRLP